MTREHPTPLPWAAWQLSPDSDDQQRDIIVTADGVRIGDVVDNAGTAARIPIYRAPDLGTTGALPAAQVVATLRAHQVIGVTTGDIKEVTVTRRPAPSRPVISSVS